MTEPQITLALTIHNRSREVSQQVADSLRLPGNSPDAAIIVLDRPTPDALQATYAAYQDLPFPTQFIHIKDGPAGWLSPVRAWNTAFRHVQTSHLYCISSDTVQAPGNIDIARKLLTELPNTALHGSASCSCGPQGQEVNWGGQAPGNLLCDAAHPRPLGFIWAAPTAPVKAIDGYDEAFMAGFWYDDNDFFYRLWEAGLNFTFTNSLHGTHIHHERTALSQAGISTNTAYMLRKWGSLDPLSSALHLTSRPDPDTTHWKHLGLTGTYFEESVGV